jgi:hypothetical protein
MQEKFTVGWKVIATEIFEVQILCQRLTKELIVLLWQIPKCMGQVEVLKMYQRV